MRGLLLVGVAVAALGPVGVHAQTSPLPAHLRSKLAVPAAYNQGIAGIPGGWILSGTTSPVPNTDVLVRTDESFNVVVRNGPAIPSYWRSLGYVHIGDIDVVGNVVYAPFEEPDYSKGHQVTARYDVRTLRFLDAVVLPQHENSFVTVDARTHIAYTMDHFDGSALLRYDVSRRWKQLPPLELSMLLHQTQGASVADGAVWISTSDDHNDLFRVDIKTGHVELVGEVLDPLGEGEGIDVTPLSSGYIHTMVVDPDRTKVWIEHFDLPGARFASRTSPGRGGSATAGWVAGAVAVLGVAAATVGLRWRRRRARRLGTA